MQHDVQTALQHGVACDGRSRHTDQQRVPMLGNQQRCLNQVDFCRILSQQLPVLLESLETPVPEFDLQYNLPTSDLFTVLSKPCG